MLKQPGISSANSESGENVKPCPRGFIIRGLVVHGNHLGRTIGFPTANIRVADTNTGSLPRGVFLVNVSIDNRVFQGICNIGMRPTIGGTQLLTEVNILDFSEDIYGREIAVTILKSIRKEKKFNSLEELGKQISLDKEKARRMLSVLNKDKAC